VPGTFFLIIGGLKRCLAPFYPLPLINFSYYTGLYSEGKNGIAIYLLQDGAFFVGFLDDYPDEYIQIPRHIDINEYTAK